MAFFCKTGTFASPADAGTDTIVAALEFKPKVLLVWRCNSNSGAAVDAILAYGAAIDDGTEYSATFVSEDAVDGTTDTSRINKASVCYSPDENGLDVEAGTVKSWNADGFTIDWSAVGGSALTYQYQALGGDDLTDYHLDAYLAKTAIDAAVTYTNPGFQPDCLIMFTACLNAAAPSSASSACIGLGWATSATNQIAMSASVVEGNINGADRVQEDGLVYNSIRAQSHGANEQDQAALVSFDPTGYTLNWSQVHSNASQTYALTLKGGQYKTQTFTSPDSAGLEVRSGFGFKPVGALTLNRSLSVSSDLNTTAAIGVGAMSGTGGISSGIIHVDTTDPTQADSHAKTDEFVLVINNGGASLEEANVDSLDDDGITLNWGKATAFVREYGVLAFGSEPVVAFEPTDPSEGIMAGRSLAISDDAIVVAWDDAQAFPDLSIEKLTLNGFPLTLYENGSGTYAIAAVLANNRGTEDFREEYFVESTYQRAVRINGSRYFPVALDSNGSTTSEKEFIWYGMPIAQNDENQLIFKNVSPGDFDEEAELRLGGMPLTVGRVDGNWYLLVYRVN